MLTTNLLPLKQKKDLRLEEIRRLLHFFTAALFGVLVLAIFFLVPSFVELLFEKRELTRLTLLELEANRRLKIEDILGEIKNLQTSIETVRSRILKPAIATETLELLNRHAARGLTLISVSVKKDGNFFLTGIAPTRSLLLDFEKSLRDSGRFQEISSPLSNIVKETNINFTLQGKLKPQFRL